MTIHDEHAHLSPVLTPAETMKSLGITRPTLNRYVEAGYLQPMRLPSGHRRFSASQVEAILARREPWEPAS
jgi:predicted site-specific integrase-resolvase